MKKLLLILFALIVKTGISAGEYLYLTVQNTDGSTSTVSLTSLTLSIENGQLVAANSETNETYTLSSLDKMYFAKSPEVTIPDIGWATLYSDCTLDLSASSVKAYTAQFGTSSVTLTPITKIPARTGIVLCGTAAEYTLPVTAMTTGLTTTNDLSGTTTDLEADDSGYYALTKNDDGTKVGFALVESGVTIPANKAFYLSSTADAGIFYSIGDIDNEGTGIATLTQTDDSEQAIYNLQGVRVKNASKGIYIINGKKVIIK